MDAIGIRIPDAPFIRAVCRQHRSALALTSANKSGGLSSIAVNEFQVKGLLGWACPVGIPGGHVRARLLLLCPHALHRARSLPCLPLWHATCCCCRPAKVVARVLPLRCRPRSTGVDRATLAPPPSPTTHPPPELWPACSLVFDGGALDAGRSGSTVIDLATPGQFVISRRGAGFARTMQLLQEKYGLRHVL